MTRGSRRRGRPSQKPGPSSANASHGTPDIYSEMLCEAVASSPSLYNDDGLPIKRRKTAKRFATPSNAPADLDKDAPKETRFNQSADSDGESVKTVNTEFQQQTVYNSSDSAENSSEDWEEVELQKEPKYDRFDTATASPPADISVTLDRADVKIKDKKGQAHKRSSIVVEKKLRFEIHKAHLLCLLMHVYMRNVWCNDPTTQEILRPLLSTSVRSYLRPNPNLSQFQRSRSFVDGLEQAVGIWRAKFTITARGLRKPTWAIPTANSPQYSATSDVERLSDRNSFRTSARTLEGSRDVGAQLFCALLRHAGVDARLVCSLQPLLYATVAKGSTPQKPRPKVVFAGIDNDHRAIGSGEDSPAEPPDTSSVKGRLANGTTQNKLRRRIGQPGSSFSSIRDPGQAPPTEIKRKKIVESPYPVFWVEVFNEAIQKWIPVDALVTHTVAKPSKFEPPSSDERNSMSYVVAFEDDGTVKDVTRRYAKAYNAKTRKSRVESVEGGERWWRRTLKLFSAAQTLDREQVEDAELTAKEAAEPMPRNIQDFKSHPYYALERHLKRNEVIHPKREVGKVSSGRPEANDLEPVYRRRDVMVVRSADKWYRLGREIKSGEQPLKWAPLRRTRNRPNEELDMDHDVEDPAGVGSYAHFQTELYTPPPIVRGLVPKNAYGNLDVYVPSMIPPGGVHLQHTEAAKAARLVGVDYADAVTGFEFRGRHGTAITQGVIIAAEFQDAVEAVITALEQEKQDTAAAKRSTEALRWWKRFMVGLRILERVKEYDEDDEDDIKTSPPSEVEETYQQAEEGGGFLPEMATVHEPTSTTWHRVNWRHELATHDSQEAGGGFFADENLLNTDEAGAVPSREDTEEVVVGQDQAHGQTDLLQDSVEHGGGFVLETLNEPNASIAAQSEAPEPYDTELTYSEAEVGPTSGHSSLVETIIPLEKTPSPFEKSVPVEARNSTTPDAPSPRSQVEDDVDSLEDGGSLLSHDPDDDDAEPEWLADY